jgi:hypothetical protein
MNSRIEESCTFDKVMGEGGLAEYNHAEDEYLSNPNLQNRNTYGDENSDYHEHQSSGDEDGLDYRLDDDDQSISVSSSSKQQQQSSNAEHDIIKDYYHGERLYPLGDKKNTSEVTSRSDRNRNNPITSASSGKLPFKLRKLRWFDMVQASDRATARQYLRQELRNLKKKDALNLTHHLKKVQRREKRRLVMESAMEDDDEDEEYKAGNYTISKLPSNMTPSLSAALVLESLVLNPKESLEGMSKCYEEIVLAGSALLDSQNETDTPDKTKFTKLQILNALTSVLVTTLEQSSGDTIIALAKLRQLCGTKRYQRRFVQRIAPNFVRPPNAALWCLRHQSDMESIFAATELILDHAFEIFSSGWYERGRTILADSHRRESLRAAADHLKLLSNSRPTDGLTKGYHTAGTDHRRRNTTAGKDLLSGVGGNGSDVLAEWEILAVDRQIRKSIENLFTKDWTRLSYPNAPPRDGELVSQVNRKKSQGISAKPKPIQTDNLHVDTDSQGISDRMLSPSRDYHHGKQNLYSQSNPAGAGEVERSYGPTHTSHEQRGSDNKYQEQSTPPQTPKQQIGTPPRLSPNVSSYQSPGGFPISPRRNAPTPPHQPPHFVDSGSSPLTSQFPSISTGDPQKGLLAPLSPSNQSRDGQRHGNSGAANGKYLRQLTSTKAERKRTVAACRALRAQITRFEDKFNQMYGRPPKGAAERAPLATTYAQYREWKRAIRADAASRIQALFRGAMVRQFLMSTAGNNVRLRKVILRRGGVPKTPVKETHLSIPVMSGSNKTSLPSQIPSARRQTIDDSPDSSSYGVEIIMNRSASWGNNSSMMSLSLSALQTLKRELKQELKQYDMDFFNQHGRMPVKAEKEPIRHLYENYNSLKNRITTLESDSSPSTNNTPQPHTLRQSWPSPSPGKNSISAGSLNTSNLSVTTNQTDSVTSVFLPGSGSISSQKVDDFSSKGTSRPRESSDLTALKDEKQALHQKLRAYEREFHRLQGRQVSSYNDIRPVAPQYRRYKEIKKMISALQSKQQ